MRKKSEDLDYFGVSTKEVTKKQRTESYEPRKIKYQKRYCISRKKLTNKSLSKGLRTNIDVRKSEQISFASLDLSANLGDLLKPSQPDFGYREIINFEESKTNQNRFMSKGWNLILDYIGRFPKRQSVHNIIQELKYNRPDSNVSKSKSKRKRGDKLRPKFNMKLTKKPTKPHSNVHEVEK